MCQQDGLSATVGLSPSTVKARRRSATEPDWRLRAVSVMTFLGKLAQYIAISKMRVSFLTRRACNMQALGGGGIAGQVNAFVIIQKLFAVGEMEIVTWHR